ncbi:MAG: hypothetical protein DMG40_19420 [Acidobacteria bacterium]|nr:MAG: hypothetical protein DMG40_19420 [Acidobacteriota bacterium]
MLALYRFLLHLYPAAYRYEYGEEMLEVLSQVAGENRKGNVLARVWFGAHEAGGLVFGALHEHLRGITGLHGNGRFSSMYSGGRFAMRSEFRFPKATVGLMVAILAAVMWTIEKAKAISASVPHANPPVGPIRPEQFTIVETLLAVLIWAIAAGAIGWAIVFAMRRSGVHHLSEMNPSAGQRSGK